MPAISVTSKQVTQNSSTGAQQTNQILSYFIDYNSTFYVMHGVSTEADFGTYNGVMESSMKTFSKLTDSSKINIKPKRIRVKKIAKAGTLADAFIYFGVQKDRYNELALLNDMELTDKVQAGKLIKIVGE